MPTDAATAQRIVFIVHYFPPINSTGGKRVEAMSKYFARLGREVTVITTRKTGGDGLFTEQVPPGVRLIELDARGRLAPSQPSSQPPAQVPASPAASGAKTRLRRFKDLVMRTCGQLPDPRLGFAFGFLSPALAPEAVQALRRADAVVSSMPPWPTHLAALFTRWRFGCTTVLDYRDQFSGNHIMPGSGPAKWLETIVDRALCRRADALVVISRPMAEYYRAFASNVHVILNGYDPEIIDDVRARTPPYQRQPGAPLSIRYLGRMSRDRIPRALLQALSRVIQAGRLDPQAIRFECYGDCQQLVDHLAAQHPALQPLFRFQAAVPYRQAIELMLTADYLLFAETSAQNSLSAQGVLTTKLFEYLACRRPILAEIAATTEAGRMITANGSAHFASTEVEAFERHLPSAGFLNPEQPPETDQVRGLSRAAQADQYLALLDQLAQARPH